MSKELEALEELRSFCGDAYYSEIYDKDYQIIETALKQAQEDNEMLNIFKNALTIERDIPPELEIKESEKGCSYVFKEAVKIHENRIEEMLKKSLREWVLKNAFPKELKALEIIKDCKITGLKLVWSDRDVMWFVYAPHCDFPIMYGYKKEEYDLLKEVLL